MKNKINSLLQQSWSSLHNGVDLDKATDSLNEYMESQLDDVRDSWRRESDSYEEEIASLQYDLDNSYGDAESLEEDMEASDKLMQDSLPFLQAYRLIQSNNPNLYQELGTLIYRIEEQIIKNGK